MNTSIVKQQIREHTVSGIYIFYGDEIKAQDIYIDKMGESANAIVRHIDCVADLFKNRTTGLFKQRILYVCRDDLEFTKTEKAWVNIKSILKNDILVLRFSALDKRTKFYKYFTESLVEFQFMTPEVLTKYIRKVIPLTVRGCEVLADICENNYSRIVLEIDKIQRYMTATNKDADSAFKELMRDGIIYIPPEDAIFDYVSAVLSHNSKLSFELLEECNKINEPALRLLTVLYTNCRKLMLVQSCPDSNIEKTTGLTAWDIKCSRPYLNKWQTIDLVNMLKLIQSIESGIKIGTIDESVAMSYFMTQVF